MGNLSVDFDDIRPSAKETKKLASADVLAKSTPRITVLDHGLHAAYIAESIMRIGRAKNLAKLYAGIYGMSTEEIINSVCFLVAAHDIGKIHPNFIANMYSKSADEKVTELYIKMTANGLLPTSPIEEFRHERYSRQIVQKYLNGKGMKPQSSQFATIIAYHHQGRDLRNFNTPIVEPSTDWIDVQKEILDKYFCIWPYSKKMGAITKRVDGFSYWALQVMVLSDWIASSQFWQDELAIEPITSIKEHAEHFICTHELQHYDLFERFKGIKWGDIFTFSPNELQKKVMEAAEDHPLLTIIEYPCGGGKTEAGIAGAFAMGKNQSGISIFTPTIATAQGMIGRVREIAKNAELDINIPELDSSSIWSDDEMDRINPMLWSSRSKHHMLYPFSVGTVDQILKGVCASRYAGITLLGAADKVLIIDEVHGYQAFTRTELEMLIKWCRAYSIPIILMSATLPTKIKKNFLKAAGCKEELPNIDAYPLLTTYGTCGLKVVPITCKGKTFNIRTQVVNDIGETMFQYAMSLKSGCMALIERTVDTAWALYNRIITTVNDDTDVILFHARDTLAHKKAKTQQLLDKFGKNRTHRPRKAIVVSTSIIEQSLDVDFDYMITALAPVDLLLQRIGRVWRHNDAGTIREHIKINVPVTVLAPKKKDILAKLYDENILQETLSVLKGRTCIDTITDVRAMVDTVYNRVEPRGDVASAIRAGGRTISSPFSDVMALLENVGESYNRFSDTEAKTREESYPSTQIAIVSQKEYEDNSFKMAKFIHQNRVVTVADYKLQELSMEPKQMPRLSNVDIYIGENGVVSDEIQTMTLEENGLRWD